MPLIKLPRKRLISMDRENIIVDIPEKELKNKKKIDMSAIKKAKGIMAYRKKELLDYAKNVRKEWD